MTRNPANAAYLRLLRLLRSNRSGTPTYREFDRDLRGVRNLEIHARIDASSIRGF